jgi:tetratricopeptide (TPR) repeat protein
MYFQIKEIVLWPRNTKFSPRRVKFETGKVTVISGASRTGKSAVIPIIDYCLGSRECSIPVKTIRDACAWFGVVVKTAGGEKLFARREPGTQRSTDEMFLMESPHLNDLPESIAKNATAENVRRQLDELAGLSKLDFASGENPSGFEGRPSFRDLSAFVFQPQNVVANPEVLFFKTDRYEHREKLRRIFPYILGAITPALLAKQHELNRLRLELRRKENELKKAETVSAEWIGELRAKLSEARELGLLQGVQNDGFSREQMLSVLQDVVNRTDATLAVSTTTISDAVRELNGLEDEESRISHELTTLRRRLSEMGRIRESAANYHEALRIQRDRLQISDWLGHHRAGDENCPVCGGNLEPSEAKLGELRSSLKELEAEAGDTFEIPAAFDREMQRVQVEVNEATEKLKAIQIRKRSLSQRSQEASTKQYQAKKVERFIGNLENALKLHKRLGEDAELRTEITQLRERVQLLQDELRRENVEDRKRRALRLVNNNAARLVPHLDCERPDDPVSLEIDDLTIKVTGANREDYLSEIGSGSNWLSYHVAMMLALQQFFLTLEHSPVPSFLVMDQPSQVYFPKKLVVREGEDLEEPRLRDEDIVAVYKAFEVMGSVVAAAKGRLQVIVLDHAPREVWGDIPGVVAFEEWRDGVKLVPTEWIS